MKVSLGFKLQEGAFGGGNQFGVALKGFLQGQGVQVIHHLQDADIDLILVGDPRPELQISAYTIHDVLHYLRQVNPKARVVHRINECDERKGEEGKINPLLRQAAPFADYVLFVSEWLRQLHLTQGMQTQADGVILNGSDTQIFHAEGHQVWDGKSPLKIVTHHWGNHWYKGFDIYQELDEWLGKAENRARFQFTYIGNLPEGFQFQHSRHLLPLSGQKLGDELRGHHLYLTASQFEPGSHHQNEGALCGLPLLYRESGGLPEYCQGFGIGFSGENFLEQLENMSKAYFDFLPALQNYPHTAEKMSQNYWDLFRDLTSKGEKSTRPWQKNDTSPLEWLKARKTDLLDFVKSLQGPQVGRYSLASQGLTPEGEQIQLPWSAWALKIHHLLDAWDELPPQDQQAWISYLLAFQVEGNPQLLAWGKNAFRDPVLMTAVMNQTPRLQRWQNRFSAQPTPQALALSAESKQAIATLQEIGVSSRLPYQGFPQTPKKLNHYLSCLDWSKPWTSGAHLATLAVFFATEAPRFLPTEECEKLKQIGIGFAAKLADPQTGGYFSGQKPAYGELINGAMKILTALDWLATPIHFPERLIDSVLADYPQAEGCHLVDAVYVLYRCTRFTDYRHEDIQNYCLQMIGHIQAHFNPIDGGFSYYIGRSQSHIHHVRVTRQRPVSDLHGTLLLTWATSMILHLMGHGEGWQILRP